MQFFFYGYVQDSTGLQRRNALVYTMMSEQSGVWPECANLSSIKGMSKGLARE